MISLVTLGFVFLGMLYMHVIDDYVLQNSLARLKQHDWWLQQSNFSKMYANDYKAALLAHAFEWSGSILCIPIIYTLIKHQELNYNVVGLTLIFLFLLNTFIHYKIDDAKANMKIINLVQDQIFHVVQVVFSFCIWVLVIILS